MDKETYHHGDLKNELIEKGLVLLNNEGVAGFSLRKVASMCGVSHNAPYKHFKDKEGLIDEIIKAVWGKFRIALLEVTNLYSHEPKLEIVEMGKAYVKFMVENPEYLKFLFLSDKPYSIIIENDKFYDYQGSAFETFKDSAERFFEASNIDKNLYLEKTLAMWSMVHGISVLISKESIKYKGDYLELVEKMTKNCLK